jgi:integrase
VKLTAKATDGLQLAPGETERTWFDDTLPGFGLRLRATGRHVWVYQFKIGGRQRKVTIGPYPAVTVAKARDIAADLAARVRLGHDVQAERLARVTKATHTFGFLVERYLAFQGTALRPRSLLEVRRHLLVHCRPLHALALDTVDRRTIAEHLNAVEAASGHTVRNRVRSSAGAMFAWGMREGLTETNPTVGTNVREEKSRERVLSDNELRDIWQHLPASDYGTIIKLLALTGCRVSEIAGLRWSEVDTDLGVICLPPSRTKNGRPHEIPLSGTIHDLLSQQPRQGSRDQIFGRGPNGFIGMGKAKRLLDQQISVSDWRHHDLRRTAATRLADIGIPPHIVEQILNHQSGHRAGVAGVYNKSLYRNEVAHALARWDQHIAAIVSGEPNNIATLRRA